jgi:membrane associated rhomboid family serine protease
VTQDRVSTWLLRSGVGVFGIGLLFVVLTFVPFFGGRHNAPLILAAATMLCPLGFGIALLALVREARQARRSARQR